jgi:hypothetical protein
MISLKYFTVTSSKRVFMFALSPLRLSEGSKYSLHFVMKHDHPVKMM